MPLRQRPGLKEGLQPLDLLPSVLIDSQALLVAHPHTGDRLASGQPNQDLPGRYAVSHIPGHLHRLVTDVRGNRGLHDPLDGSRECAPDLHIGHRGQFHLNGDPLAGLNVGNAVDGHLFTRLVEPVGEQPDHHDGDGDRHGLLHYTLSF